MSRHAYCMFCDDIRVEVGYKNSLMGIYGGVLNVAEFPAILPKLCVMTYCETPVDRPFNTLTARVSLDGNLVNETIVPPDFLSQAAVHWADQGTAEDPITIVALGLSVIMSPLPIEKESVLTVEVIADGEAMIAGKLRLRKGLAIQQD